MALGSDFALSDAKAFTQCVESLAEFGERVVVCFHIVFLGGTHKITYHPGLQPPLLPEGGEFLVPTC